MILLQSMLPVIATLFVALFTLAMFLRMAWILDEMGRAPHGSHGQGLLRKKLYRAEVLFLIGVGATIGMLVMMSDSFIP